MKSPKFDDLDRRIIQALQLDGRVPFSKVGRALEVSEQTIARRYTRLRTEGYVRVVAAVEYASIGDVAWLVRAQCKPDEAENLGRVLAAREDTAWVTLSSGGTEINCLTWAPAGEAHGRSVLLARLPHTPSVVSMTAHCVLHTFFGGPRGPVLKYGCLLPEQEAALTSSTSKEPPRASGDQQPVVLDDADRRMLAVLGRDGRADYAELAAATNWSQSTVKRRLAQLRASGAVYLDVEFDYRIYGLTTRALLWALVPPEDLETVGLALAEHPEVGYACATTGATNLHAMLLCRNIDSVYRYLAHRLGPLGVRHVETAPIMRGLKGSAIVHAPR